jgi:AraC-like DNA-binding protein
MVSLRENQLVRSAALTGYKPTAISLGLDVNAAIANVGLKPSCLEDPEKLISIDAFMELLELSAEMSSCPDFGIRAAIARGIPDLGPVSLLLREAETVGDALKILDSNVSLHSGGIFMTLDARFGSPFIAINVVGRMHAHSVQATEFSVTGLVQNLRWLISDDWCPEQVAFSHPRSSTTRLVNTFFGCQISYNQALSGIMIPRELLSRQLNSSQPHLRKFAKRYLEAAFKPRPGFAAKVARCVERTLGEGACTLEEISGQFGVDRRTLNRRLAKENENFSSIVQQIRKEVARAHLEATNCSLTELSDATGFQSLSAFSRWFNTSFGCTASEWRSRSSDVSDAIISGASSGV